MLVWWGQVIWTCAEETKNTEFSGRILVATQQGGFVAVFSVPSFFVSLLLLKPKGLILLQYLGLTY